MASGKILIFGGSRGLGRAIGEAYSLAGWEVIALGHRDCDFTDPVAVRGWVAANRPRLSGLKRCVFSAGKFYGGFADELNPDRMVQSYWIHFFAPMILMRELALDPAVRCPKFIFVLTGIANILIPGLSPYSLSKRALRDWLTYVRLDRAFQGVEILEVWPGRMDTDFNKDAEFEGSFHPAGQDKGGRDPAGIASRVLRADRAGKRKINLSPMADLMGILQVFWPGFTKLFVRREQTREQK
jgi:NAD(P)-dependent dehydrogenase (short-subunit alcohol dehydrogenase family)